MRNQIKEIATELLIRHGYRGLRFHDIAERLGTTRGNVHYHFGNKESLAEEVIIDYVETTLSSFQRVWTSKKSTLGEKVAQTVDLNRKRYSAFNSAKKTGEPWSLIARMRLDRELLSARSVDALAEFGVRLHELMLMGLNNAVERGELRADAPIEDLALQLVSVANSAAAITQDAGSFDRLEHLYLSLLRIMMHAYGTEGSKAASTLERSTAS